MSHSPEGAAYARWDGVGVPFTLVEVPVPAPSAGEAVVRIDMATVCGSDVHTVCGHRPAPAPSVLGHEQVGHVVAVGDAPPVTADGSELAVGDRVVWSVTASCGTCRNCRRGLPQKCERLRKYGHERLTPEWELSGGYATHCLLLPGTTIVRVPADVPDDVASPLACASATVAAAVAASPALEGARVLITGAGMLGVITAAMATAAGAAVAVVDPDPRRRDVAIALGAMTALDIGEPVSDIDVAFEMSGSPVAVESCIQSLDIGGTAVLVGSVSTSRPVAIDPEQIVRRLITVRGVHNYAPADLVTAVGFAAEHHRRLPLAGLVAGYHDLADVDAALSEARAGVALRVAVVPGRAQRHGEP